MKRKVGVLAILIVVAIGLLCIIMAAKKEPSKEEIIANLQSKITKSQDENQKISLENLRKILSSYELITSKNLDDEDVILGVKTNQEELILLSEIVDIKSLDMEITDKSYIAGGLLIFYDAINNTGNGHSDTTNIWKNLALVDEYDGTLLEFDAGWNDKSLSFDGTDSYVNTHLMQGKKLGNNFTIMSTASMNEAVKFRAVGGGHGITPGVVFGQWQPSGLSFGIYNLGILVSFPFGEVELGENYGMAMTISEGATVSAYLGSSGNKREGTVKYFDNLSDEVLKVGWAFPLRSDGERYHQGTVSSFLVYDRALSEMELDWNLKVETARY
ncbi:MAG: hypothetical protein LBQ02_04585 [Candidatus Nomurabacteria bacterium]|jgi:hypothetical protein|nr:hypothetical protein [Candidatus Nomurabacteria bacterium]